MNPTKTLLNHSSRLYPKKFNKNTPTITNIKLNTITNIEKLAKYLTTYPKYLGNIPPESSNYTCVVKTIFKHTAKDYSKTGEIVLWLRKQGLTRDEIEPVLPKHLIHLFFT